MKQLLLPLTGVAYLVGSLIVVVGVVRWHQPAPFHPLRDPSPQRVVDASNAHPGGTVSIEGTKCNDSDTAIGFDAQTYWQNLSNPAIRILRSDSRGITREPGCSTRVSTGRQRCR